MASNTRVTVTVEPKAVPNAKRDLVSAYRYKATGGETRYVVIRRFTNGGERWGILAENRGGGGVHNASTGDERDVQALAEALANHGALSAGKTRARGQSEGVSMACSCGETMALNDVPSHLDGVDLRHHRVRPA